MRGKFVHLTQNKDQFPLLGTDLYFVNPQMILNTTLERDALLSNVDQKLRDELLFGIHMHPGGVYPRFNRNESKFQIRANPLYSFLPNLSSLEKLDFSDITDKRALELLDKSRNFERVYLFWSGGIDSTLILCAILKNWSHADLEKLHIVLNKYSIEENLFVYNTYIREKIKTVPTDKFFSGEINLDHNSVYVDGNVGDTVTYLCLDYFDNAYPGYYNKPWRSNINVLVEFFSTYMDTQYGYEMYKRVVRSLNANNLEVETIYDFLWWITFNWLHDKLLYNILWQYTPCVFSNENFNTQQFLEENMFQWFNSEDYQNWTVSTIGTDLRIRDSISTNKYSFKKYIYDFNKDYDYFLNKLKERSTPRNKVDDNHIILCAIDSDYNYYYRHTYEKVWPPKQ